MNEQQVFTIGPLMKAARKFKKFNQADVAQAIGCSQSALSKMEHNLLVPSAPQWFLFARFTSIAPESLETGIIDRHSKVKFNNDQVSLGFKIPKKYRHYRAEKVREIYPFLQYLEKKLTPPLHKDFMMTTGLDPEFYLDFDNLISFQLFLDVAEYFIKLGKNTPEELKGIVRFGQNDIYWDHFNVEWRKLAGAEAVLDAYAREQVFFQSDFQIKVESATGKITVSYYPEYHLKQMASAARPEVIQFLNCYRQATLENLVDRVLGQKIHVNLVSEVGASPFAARFEVRAAA
jgi:transcriptional regulator with XRE-family HTH domain